MDIIRHKKEDKKQAEVKLFHDLQTQQKVALFVTCILQMPVEFQQIMWVDEPQDMCWNKAALVLLVSELEIEEGYMEAYRDYYPRDFSSTVPSDLCIVFTELVHSSNLDTIETIAKLCVFLITHGLYDARGRTWMRNIVRSMHLSSHEVVSLERTLCRALCNIGDSLQRKQKDEKKTDYKRYAKIGAASLGAGAVIALTGGLAAPAIAAALLVMGSATAAAAATFTTATIMASLFGTAGAGLTGYKMMRRTRGIEEFEFEEYKDDYGDKRKLAIVIMVSGWMIEPEDYRKTFGVVPENMSLEERLRRFYEIHCPARTASAKEEAREWQNDPDTLLDQMTELYGVDPRTSVNLCQPAYSPTPLAPATEERLRTIIETVLARADSVGATSENAKHQHKSTDNPLEPAGLRRDDEMAQPKSARESGSSDANRRTNGDEKGLRVEVDVASAGDEKEGDVEVALEDDTEERMKNSDWSWHELEISSVMELHLLKWETEIQMELGRSIVNLLKSLRDAVAEKVLATTVLAALLSAVFVPVTLLKLTDVIDNTWTLAVERADEAGRELAHALLLRPQGSRAVTLVGHSVGSRLVFSCLQELARCKEKYKERQLSLHPSSDAGSKATADDTMSDKARSAMSSIGGSLSRSWKSSFGSGEKNTGANAQRIAKPPIVGAAPPPSRAPDESKNRGSVARETDGENDSDGHHRAVTVGEVTSQDREVWDESEAIEESYRFADCIIQDVVLLGTPVGTDIPSWERARSVVSGRLINGYSSNDLVLALLYRYEKWAVHVAGVTNVDIPGVENVDFGHIVNKHTDYSLNMKEILESLNLAESVASDISV